MGFFNFIKHFQRKELRIVVLGLDNAGKTSITRFLTGKDLETCATVSMEQSSFQSLGYKINICDLGGNRNIRQFWKSQYENCNVVIYVVDSSDPERLEESCLEFKIILEDEKLRAPLLIYANKQDQPFSLSADLIASSFGLYSLHDRIWHIQPCSITQKQGLLEGLDWILKRI